MSHSLRTLLLLVILWIFANRSSVSQPLQYNSEQDRNMQQNGQIQMAGPGYNSQQQPHYPQNNQNQPNQPQPFQLQEVVREDTLMQKQEGGMNSRLFEQPQPHPVLNAEGERIRQEEIRQRKTKSEYKEEERMRRQQGVNNPEGQDVYENSYEKREGFGGERWGGDGPRRIENEGVGFNNGPQNMGNNAFLGGPKPFYHQREGQGFNRNPQRPQDFVNPKIEEIAGDHNAEIKEPDEYMHLQTGQQRPRPAVNDNPPVKIMYDERRFDDYYANTASLLCPQQNLTFFVMFEVFYFVICNIF